MSQVSKVEIEEWTFDGEQLTWRFFQVRLYGHGKRSSKDNFVAGFLVRRRGDSRKGKLGGLAGPGFYSLIGPHIKEIYSTCGVDEMEFKVLDSHARLVQHKLRHFTNMTLAKKEVEGERTFNVFRMTVKEHS